MKICFKCNTLFERHFDIGFEKKICPVKDCFGDVVEIDDNIFHTIQILNLKGYMTDFCCSGHLWGGSPYIVFNEMVNKNCFDKYPSGFLPAEFGSKAYFIHTIESTDILERQKELNESVFEILKWSEDLSGAKILRANFLIQDDSRDIDIEKMVKDELHLFFCGEWPIGDGFNYAFKSIVTPGIIFILSKNIQDFAVREKLPVSLEIIDYNSEDRD